MSDAINHPLHYNKHPSGVEAIEVCQHLDFCLGNAVKYIWRAGMKGDHRQDLEKARWYLQRVASRFYLFQPTVGNVADRARQMEPSGSVLFVALSFLMNNGSVLQVLERVEKELAS